MSIKHQEKLRSEFFDDADLLFYLFDENLNLIDTNELGLKTFNYKKEDVLGKNLEQISPGNKASGRYDLYLNVIKTGKTIIIDDVRPHPSLGNLYFQIKAFKVGNGLGLISKDVTDVKTTIADLELFIYKSSHDLRSPVSSILGLLNIAEKETVNLSDAKLFYSMIRTQTERLDTILKVLNDAMKIRKGEKVIHLINFEEVLTSVFESLRFMQGFSELRIEKRITSGLKFYSDKLILTSILHNLIDNAVKYKKENFADAKIEITIEPEKNGVKIIVEDNGIGIPEHLKQEVFKMFFRATDKAMGSGLGLYTVKQSLLRLKGNIHLESTEKVGTKFTVYIPSEQI